VSAFAVDPRVRALVPRFDAPFFQAGLAGYSDGAMRLVARRHGAPYCVSEALLDRTILNGGKGRAKEDPDLLAAECGLGDPELDGLAGVEDHPIAGQLMGSDPGEMAAAARVLVAMGYDVIDVNLACPVKKIRKACRGGHLLTDAERAIAILRAVRDAVPREVPCTVKLRRAYDDTPEMARSFERIFVAAYELGLAWATVHCRTVVQKYVGPARWPFLTDLVRRHPDKVIFGSGDVWTAGDIFAMREVTGVHGVAVARGAIGNPWIFRQARARMAGVDPAPPTVREQRRALLAHFELSVALHGERRASALMRKFGIKFAEHHPDAEAVRRGFIGAGSIAEWHGVIDRFYPEVPPAPGEEPGPGAIASNLARA
jgi:tRNA-dihydrouridine synthase